MALDPPPPHRTNLVARRTTLILTFAVCLLRTRPLVGVIALEARGREGSRVWACYERALCATPRAISWIYLAHSPGLLSNFQWA